MRMPIKLVSALAGLLAASSASAAIINGGFENGLTGWSTFTQSGNSAASAIGSVGLPASTAPNGSVTMASIHAGATNVYQKLWQDFSASTGDSLSAWVRWNGNDYLGDNGEWNDDGYARVGLVNGNSVSWLTPSLWTADVATWGPYNNANGGNSPWTPLLYNFSSAGTYRIEFAVRNVTDDDFQQASEVFVDNVTLTTAPVPEPGELGMMALGFGVLGVLHRRKAASAA